MCRNFLLAVVFAAAGGSLFAQPVVSDGGILNAASYMSAKLPGGAIAQGSIFVIFGSGMGPASIAQAGFPLPNTLAGTGVKVTSGGQTLDCPLVYTLAGQIAAILPSTTPVGNATLTVTYNGATSAARSFRVVESAFGTFSLNQAGSGPGVITNFESATSQPVNTAFRSARPGQTLILYGTGLGKLPAGANDNTAAPAGAINQDKVEVYVGAQKAAVAYAGRAPGFAGLDQINLVVPAGTTGCAIPIAIKIGLIVSNYTTIAVAPNGGTCSDPLGLTSSQLDKLNSGGTLRVGAITLARIESEIALLGFSGVSRIDSGSASFEEFTAQTINSGGQTNFNGLTSVGTCFVFVGTSASATPVDPIQPKQLDAGPVINVSGPKGAKTLKKTPPDIGIYSDTLANATSISGLPSIPGVGGGDPDGYLVPGTYNFNNGAGGADVKGFTTTLQLAAPVAWTNKAAISTVNRGNGVTVNWTGGDPNGYVEVFGFSSSDTSNTAVSGTFVCIERASVGTFTVPAAVLLALPPTPTGGAATGTFGALAVGGFSSPGQFTAAGIDTGTIAATSVSLKTVNYQ